MSKLTWCKKSTAILRPAFTFSGLQGYACPCLWLVDLLLLPFWLLGEGRPQGAGSAFDFSNINDLLSRFIHLYIYFIKQETFSWAFFLPNIPSNTKEGS